MASHFVHQDEIWRQRLIHEEEMGKAWTENWGFLGGLLRSAPSLQPWNSLSHSDLSQPRPAAAFIIFLLPASRALDEHACMYISTSVHCREKPSRAKPLPTDPPTPSQTMKRRRRVASPHRWPNTQRGEESGRSDGSAWQRTRVKDSQPPSANATHAQK